MQKSALLLQQFYKKCAVFYLEHNATFLDLSQDVEGFVRAVEDMRILVFDHPDQFTINESLGKTSLAVGQLTSELQYKETEIKRKHIPDTEVLRFSQDMETMILEADYPGLLSSNNPAYSKAVAEIPRLSEQRLSLITTHLPA